MGADMKRTIGRVLGAFLLGVVTVAAGVLLAIWLYFGVLLPTFVVPETTVETREVPVEETVGRPMDRTIVIEGFGDNDVIEDIDPGVWLIVGAGDLQPIRITSLEHSVGANWNAGREVVVFHEDYVLVPGGEPRDYLVFPSGRVRFKKAADGLWTITLHRIPSP